MPSRSVRSWLLALLLIYLSMIVLVTGTNLMHLRPDENLVYDYTRNDLGFLLRYLAEQDSHPPLWFSTFWLWRQFVGDGEFVGRLYAAFCSMLTLALAYQIGRRWLGAPRFGLFAVALLGVNSFFFIYSLEIRPYGLILLLVTASMWFLQRWLARQSMRAALYYAVTLGLMLYIHYFLFVLMLVQGLVFLLWRPSRRLIRQGLGVVAIALLIWLPWLPFAVFQVKHVRAAELQGGNARGLIGAGSTTLPTSLDAVQRLVELATNGNVLLFGAILLLGLIYLWRKANYRLVLAWAFGVPAVSLLVNLLIAVYLPRYIVYMVIGFALAVGAGLAVLPTRLRFPALAAVMALSLWTLPSQLPLRIPYRDMFQTLSRTAQPGDSIFFDRAGLDDGFVRAQVARYLSADLNWVSSVEEARAARRVWYVSGGAWLSEEVRQRFAQVERDHPLQQVIGRCDREWCYVIQLLEAAPNQEPALFGEILSFWGADIDRVDEHGVNLRLWWSAASAPGLDYSIALHLLDANGQLVAQQDGPIVDYYTDTAVQTSQLTPGKLYINPRQLPLPPGLPDGTYQLRLLVYQSWDNQHLLLPDGSDYLMLDSIELPPQE